MSPDNSKAALIELLSQLKVTSLPSKQQAEVSADIRSITDLLAANHIHIPATPEAEAQITHFLELFFSVYPTLMTPENKVVVLESNLDKSLKENLRSKSRPNLSR